MGRVPACVAGHGRGWYRRHTADTAAGADAAGTTSPRIGLVIGLWQCDKENHGWCEGLPLTVAAKFRSEDRAFTLPACRSQTKKKTAFRPYPPTPSFATLAGILPFRGSVRIADDTLGIRHKPGEMTTCFYRPIRHRVDDLPPSFRPSGTHETVAPLRQTHEGRRVLATRVHVGAIQERILRA